MKYDEMICFRCAVAVAVSCLEDERPHGEEATPQGVATYITHVLDIVFAHSGIKTSVVPMVYPSCCKVPLIIRLHGMGDRLLWYHQNADSAELAEELEGALHDLIQAAVCVSA